VNLNQFSLTGKLRDRIARLEYIWLMSHYYFAPGSAVSRISISVSMFVCQSARISQNNMSKLQENYMNLLPVPVAWSLSSRPTLCTSGLWMTSYFHIKGQTRIKAWNLQRSELFTVTRQVAPLIAHPGAKSDCFVSCGTVITGAVNSVEWVSIKCSVTSRPGSSSSSSSS